MKIAKIITAMALVFMAYIVDQVVTRYVMVQEAPALMFSNGPEQVFGLELIRSISLGGEVVLCFFAIILLYSAFKSNKKGSVSEDSR